MEQNEMHCSECREPLGDDAINVELVNIDVCSEACAATLYRDTKKKLDAHNLALREIVRLIEGRKFEGLEAYSTLGAVLGTAKAATGYFGYVPAATDTRRAA